MLRGHSLSFPDLCPLHAYYTAMCVFYLLTIICHTIRALFLGSI